MPVLPEYACAPQHFYFVSQTKKDWDTLKYLQPTGLVQLIYSSVNSFAFVLVHESWCMPVVLGGVPMFRNDA